MATKRKTTTAIVAGVTAAALLLGGTFAWTSISQQAKNEAIVDINPGGRLHDDFNGTNKDVYVENFSSGATGVNIFARIRLDQYFEVGQEAGKNKTAAMADRNVNALIGGDINDVTTWITYKPGDTLGAPIQANDNWQWTLGNDDTNMPYYMPTFNMNKDSLKADINGTYEGTVEGDIVHYDDYKKYDATSTATGNEVHDWDSNADEEEEGTTAEGFPAYSTTNPNAPIDDAHVYLKEETHTAQQIDYTATVYTMAEWIAAGSPVGPYWVYDTDGWAYWAQPIAPGTTTGLLLDSITMSKVPDDNYYYGINVVADFATKGDIYMFDDMSPEAEELFATVSGSEEIVISGDDTVLAGGTATYTATRNIFGENATTQPASFTWDASATDADGNAIEGITMTNGTLTVADTVPHGTKITVTATAGDGTATADGETTVLAGTKTVIVEGVNDITATGGTTHYTPGTELTETFTATLKGAAETDGTVTWAVADGEGNALTETAITGDGSLSIGANETASKIIVTATYKSNAGDVEFSGTYMIHSTVIETTDDMAATAYALFTDDGNSGYTMTFVRSDSSIAANKSTYQGETIVNFYPIDEDYLYTPQWWYGEERSKVTSVSFANPIAPVSMYSWFSYFSSLKSVDFTNLDGSNITSIEALFNEATAIESIDMSGVRVSETNQIDITDVFYNCSSLKELKVPEKMTVVTKSRGTARTFTKCQSLVTITGLETWDVSNVSYFSYMFYYCENLKNINLSGWEFDSATSLECMFLLCKALEEIPGAEDWNVSTVRNMTQTFQSCSSLKLNCEKWDVGNVTSYNYFNSNAPGVTLPLEWQTTTE